MLPPSDFFERVQFSLTYIEIPWLDKLPLTGKIMNFPGIVTDVTQEYCEEIRNGLFQKKSTPPTTEGMLENLTGGGGGGLTALEIQTGGGLWT